MLENIYLTFISNTVVVNMKSLLEMFQEQKLLMLFIIMFVFGRSAGSESSQEIETPKHFPSQDIGIADGLKEPLKYDPKTYLDINEQESKIHPSKNLPEVAILGSLAGQNTKLETVVEPAKVSKNEPDHLSYENSESPDDPKNSTESNGSTETEKSMTANKIGKVKEYAGDFLIKLKATPYPVTHKTTFKPNHLTSTEKEIESSNVTQEATNFTGSAETEKPPVLGIFGKIKEQAGNVINKVIGTQEPVTHKTTLKPNHQTSTKKYPESSDVTQEATKSSGSAETEKPPVMGIFGKFTEIGEAKNPTVFLKEDEISGNKVQEENAGHNRKPTFLEDPGIRKAKASQNPFNHKLILKTDYEASANEDSTKEDSIGKDSVVKDSATKASKLSKGSAKTTDKPGCNEQATKMPTKFTRENDDVKVEESSESNALRTYDASLACFILNLVLLIVVGNNLIF